MEKIICVVFIFVIISYVIAEDYDNLACCPSSNYLFTSDECWDPKSNITSPMRLVCVETIRIKNFTVNAGKVSIKFSDLYTEYFDSTLACYGNMTWYRNLTKVKLVALLCVKEEEEESILEDTTLGYCMIVSVVFLGLTAIIYSILSELRDLFGKSVINFSGSLAIGLAIISIMKLMTYSHMASCATRGFLAYFFILAAFFWTNSISIQLLRDIRRPSTSADYGWKELKWYVLYSWGTPTILTISMAIVNFVPGDHRRPGIGLNHCWFIDMQQHWFYMYSVMTILLIVNIGIFIYIATIVWRNTFLHSTHIQAIKFKLSMTVRLIVLMGLPWIFEMISSAAGGTHIIWTIMDVFNSLQGILVFLVLVVFRKRVIKLMHERGWLYCCSGVVEQYLAVGDNAEENVIEHTEVPMHDDLHNNGTIRT